MGIEQVALAALAGDALETRARWQDFVWSNQTLAGLPPPATTDPVVASLSAALVELLAERRGEPPPPWAMRVEALPEPRLLVRAATAWKRERLAETSPGPLRKRNFLAPAGYLESA
jgi:hypothetical protein